MTFDPTRLESLKHREKERFRRKENWQKRMISWFGLGTGIALVVEFGRAYYYLIISRHFLPDVADTSHVDLEFNAILGMVIGVIVAVVPMLISYIISKHPPRDFAVIRVEDNLRWLKGMALLSVLVGVVVFGLGVVFVLATWVFKQEADLSGMVFVAIFGSLLLAGPLVVEGFWTMFMSKNGISKVFVLRGDTWRSW